MLNIPRDALPDFNRPDARLVLAGLWTAGTPAAQQTAADAALDGWENAPMPAAALTHACLLGEDGRTIFHYSQWADDQGLEDFLAGATADYFAVIGRAVPGGVVHPLRKYRLYRSTSGGASAAPGCVVTVSVAFDGPDAERLRTWVDLVLAAMQADPPIAGGLAGHFHVSLDGAHVLNVAEWTDAESHERAIGRDPSPEWRAVRHFTGIVSADVKRFLPYRMVSRQPVAEHAP